jgi:hypothetical protein
MALLKDTTKSSLSVCLKEVGVASTVYNSNHNLSAVELRTFTDGARKNRLRFHQCYQRHSHVVKETKHRLVLSSKTNQLSTVIL